MVRDGMGVKLSDFRITGNDIRIKSITIVVGLAGLKLVIATVHSEQKQVKWRNL